MEKDYRFSEREPGGPTVIWERQHIPKCQEYKGERFIAEHPGHFEVDMPVGLITTDQRVIMWEE